MGSMSGVENGSPGRGNPGYPTRVVRALQGQSVLMDESEGQGVVGNGSRQVIASPLQCSEL